jgi:hypothetical protein
VIYILRGLQFRGGCNKFCCSAIHNAGENRGMHIFLYGAVTLPPGLIRTDNGLANVLTLLDARWSRAEFEGTLVKHLKTQL